jgi:hypothetical protein
MGKILALAPETAVILHLTFPLNARIVHAYMGDKTMIYAVSLDNDEWPEDRYQAVAIVSADNEDKARKLVEDYGEPLNTKWMPISDIEEVSNLTSDLENAVITYFLS